MPRPAVWRRPALACLLLLGCAAGVARAEDQKSPEPDRKALESFFRGLQEAAAAGDHQAIAAAFDADEIVAWLEREGYLALVPAEKRAPVVAGLRIGLAAALAQPGMVQPFASFEIRSVKPGSAPDTFTVYLRAKDADGAVVRERWHLRRRGTAWGAFDIEDLDLGNSMMAVVGAVLVDAVQGGAGGLRQVAHDLQRAGLMVMEGRFEPALELLRELQTKDMPDAVQGMLQLLLAGAMLGSGDAAGALEHLGQVEEIDPDMPVTRLMRAVALNILGEHEQALKQARAYVALLEEDAAANLEIGKALYGLGRRDEALTPLRRSLQEVPGDYEAVAWLALSLPADGRAEVVPLFEKLDERELSFAAICDVCLAQERADVLRFFADVQAKHAPAHHDVAFYRGQAWLLDGRLDKAVTEFGAALDALERRAASPEGLPRVDRLPYIEAWLDAMVGLERHLAAYEQSAHKVFAFRYLARDLARKQKADLLVELIGRVEDQPDLRHDLAFYRAEAHFLQGHPGIVVQELRPLRATLEPLSEADEADDHVVELLWDVEDRLIRSLVRTQGASRQALLDEALVLAQRIAARDDDWDYVLIVRAQRGEVPHALEALAKAVEDPLDARRLFDDPDLKPILGGAAYADARAKYLSDR